MNKSESISALAAALAKAQGEMQHASKDATNPHFRSKYADLAAVVEAIRAPMSSNGLAYSQLCDFTEQGGLVVETVLMHSSGEWISGRLHMPLPKNDPQGVGSALTYGKRYSLAAIVGIASDEDDDAEAAMGRQEKQPRQQAPKPAQNAANVDPKDAEYHQRIKDALRTIYGDDKAAALDKIEDLTAWTTKEGKAMPGVRDFTKKTGKGAQILCHQLEKLAGMAS